MIKNILLMIVAFGGGVTVGSAAAAFIALLEVVPRLTQISNTRNHIKIYEYTLTSGFVVFTLIYFTDFHLNLNKYVAIPTGFLYGMFIGIFSSALAEVLNVIPVMAKKFKLRDSLNYIIYILMFGKVLGSIFYWLFIKW